MDPNNVYIYLYDLSLQLLPCNPNTYLGYIRYRTQTSRGIFYIPYLCCRQYLLVNKNHLHKLYTVYYPHYIQYSLAHQLVIRRSYSLGILDQD